MGGGESKQLEVEEIRNSNAGKSPRRVNKSPAVREKEASPLGRRKSGEVASELLAVRTSESTINDNSRTLQESDTRSKKKIKSVKKLPPSLSQPRPMKEAIEEVQQLNVSGKYDRKAKNQKHEMHKLLRTYDFS